MATTAEPAHPRNHTDPPRYHPQSVLYTFETEVKLICLSWGQIYSSAFTWVKPALFYGILGLFSWGYYISFFLVFLTVNPFLRFSFFSCNSAVGINTGTGNKALQLIWHTECQFEMLNPGKVVVNTVYIYIYTVCLNTWFVVSMDNSLFIAWAKRIFVCRQARQM